MKTIKQKEKFFNEISEKLEFYIMDHFQTDDLENINEFDELQDELQEQGAFDVEIIYYYKAMEYLMENDTGLNESMRIADEHGYEVKSLNSELLASLLASENAREEFYELRDKIEEFLKRGK